MLSGFIRPLESQRTLSGTINGPRASLSVPEYTLVLEVSKQDVEETCTFAESSAPRSLTLCRCVNPALGLDHFQAQDISLSAPLRYHRRTSGCLITPQYAKHLDLDTGLPRVTLFLVQKIHIALGISHRTFQGDKYHTGKEGITPPSTSCSHHQEDIVEPKAG